MEYARLVHVLHSPGDAQCQPHLHRRPQRLLWLDQLLQGPSVDVFRQRVQLTLLHTNAHKTETKRNESISHRLSLIVNNNKKPASHFLEYKSHRHQDGRGRWRWRCIALHGIDFRSHSHSQSMSCVFVLFYESKVCRNNAQFNINVSYLFANYTPAFRVQTQHSRNDIN